LCTIGWIRNRCKVSLLWQHRAEREMSASVCSRSMAGFLVSNQETTQNVTSGYTSRESYKTTRNVYWSGASVCLSLAAYPHYCTDPDVTWGNGMGCPVVVHYRADLQSVHRFCCYNNIGQNAKCQRVLVLAPCLTAFDRRR